MEIIKNKIVINLLIDSSSIILCGISSNNILSIINKLKKRIFYLNFSNRVLTNNESEYSSSQIFKDKSNIIFFNDYFFLKLNEAIKMNDIIFIEMSNFTPDFIQNIFCKLNNEKTFYIFMNIDIETLKKYEFLSNFKVVNLNNYDFNMISNDEKKNFLKKLI